MPDDVRPAHSDLRAFVYHATATLLLMVALAAQAAEPIAPGVLILHSNQRITPAGIVIENTLRTVVPAGMQRPVELFSEYLDMEWASTETLAAAQAEFLRQKYSERNVGVIVASAPQALQFTSKYRDRMLPGVPVVHLAMPKDQLERSRYPPDVIGRSIDLDPTSTLQLALRLHPDARRLVIVLGAADRDRIWEQRLRSAVARLERPIDVEYLKALPNADVVRRLGALSKDTIVYTPGYFVDGAGRVGTPRESLELMGPVSAAPIYGPLDTFLGTGIVGGYVTPYEDQAKEVGAIVVRLLNGTPPAAIPSSSVATVPMVDWRAVRRFGIDERLLPSETVVRFREPTAWEKYRWEFSLAMLVVLIQAGLIAALLIQRRSRRQIATALDESQKQMTLAAHAAKLSVWMWDVARDKARPATRARQPASEPPVAFDDVLKHVHSADRADLERAVQKARRTGEEIDVEYRVLGAEGDLRWIAARGRAEQGDHDRLLGVAIDVTERKRAELRAVEDRNALRHMTRVSMLGQLSASIAHQLNQPLAAILGNAEAARKMLGRENVDLDELRAICSDIVDDDNRAAEVIRRLSALYKRGDMKMEQIDLNALIVETLDLLRAELLIRHVTPVTDLAESLPKIDGGSVQMQQVVLNLIMNAADAMRERKVDERSLTIRTETNGTDARLYVVDQGTGIAPEDLRNIFDAFWSTKAGGMGIGLAICQSIVAAHRGKITASNNPQGGATFCVSLPMETRS